MCRPRLLVIFDLRHTPEKQMKRSGTVKIVNLQQITTPYFRPLGCCVLHEIGVKLLRAMKTS